MKAINVLGSRPGALFTDGAVLAGQPFRGMDALAAKLYENSPEYVKRLHKQYIKGRRQRRRVEIANSHADFVQQLINTAEAKHGKH